jgi:hypothetical protein
MTGPEGFTFESAYRGEVPSLGVGPSPVYRFTSARPARQTAIRVRQEANMRSVTQHSALGDGHEVLAVSCARLNRTTKYRGDS